MTSLAGSVLVARPPLRDSFFARTVILLLQHGEEGAFGLVLNRPAETGEMPFPLFLGGPCKLEGLLMLHGERTWLEPGKDAPPQVCPGVYIGDAECFERISEPDAKGKFRVFANYSGWSPEQLESELDEGSWIIVPATSELIFDTPIEEMWHRVAPQATPQPSMN